MEHRFISKRYWGDRTTPMGKRLIPDKDSGIIDLTVGDPDLNTDDGIIEAAMKDAFSGHTHYTDFRGDPELRAEIIKAYKEDYGMDFGDDEVFICASGTMAMFLTMEAILDDGDEVILQTPCFTPYPDQVRLARGIPLELPTYEEEDFQIDLKRLEGLITDRTKAIVINSPSNPTGSCLSRETMEALAKLAEERDLVVVSDEIYTAFSFQHPFIPFASIPGMRERTVTINSFSKNYTMTGWRVGNILAPDYIISAVKLVNDNTSFTASSVSQRAALYALRHRREIQDPLIEEYKKRVYYAAERINKIPNMSVLYPPKGTFYLFVNIKKTGLTGQEVVDRMLSEAKVNALPGIAFGSCGEGYVRIACTRPVEVLAEAFDRIEGMSIFQR